MIEFVFEDQIVAMRIAQPKRHTLPKSLGVGPPALEDELDFVPARAQSIDEESIVQVPAGTSFEWAIDDEGDSKAHGESIGDLPHSSTVTRTRTTSGLPARKRIPCARLENGRAIEATAASSGSRRGQRRLRGARAGQGDVHPLSSRQVDVSVLVSHDRRV